MADRYWHKVELFSTLIYSVTAVQLYSFIALQRYSVTALQRYSCTALQRYSFTALQLYSFTAVAQAFYRSYLFIALLGLNLLAGKVRLVG